MKKFFIKSGIALLSSVIFLASVIICMASANNLEYIKITALAEKNSDLIEPPSKLPGQNYGKADSNLLKSDTLPLTIDDFSYIVLDGIRIDMPCTLGDIAEHFEIRCLAAMDGIRAFIMKDDITFASVTAAYNGSKPPYSDCIVTDFMPYQQEMGFIPEIIIGGITHSTSFAEYNRLTGGNGEYAFIKDIVFATGENEYLVIGQGAPYSDGSYIPIEFIRHYKNPTDEEREDWEFTEFEPIIDKVYCSDSYIPAEYEPISIEGLDFSKIGAAIELTDNPCICIYDVLLAYSAMGTEAYAEIESHRRIDYAHEYIEFYIYSSDGELINRAKTVLKDGQRLGEALLIEE